MAFYIGLGEHFFAFERIALGYGAQLFRSHLRKKIVEYIRWIGRILDAVFSMAFASNADSVCIH